MYIVDYVMWLHVFIFSQKNKRHMSMESTHQKKETLHSCVELPEDLCFSGRGQQTLILR